MRASPTHVPLIDRELMAAEGVAVRKHLHALELDVYDLATEPPVEFPRHYHDVAHFSFLMRGELNWSSASRRHEHLPWRGFFHPAGVDHSVFLGARTRCFTVEVGGGWIDRLNEHAPPPAAPVMLADDSRPVATRLLAEFRNLRPCSLLVIEGLTAELLGDAARRVGGVDRRVPLWMNGLLDRLRAEFARPPHLNELALAMNLHPGRLSRSFRRATGKTIGDYVRDLRVQFVLRRLADGEEPIAELALAAGYHDQSHCTREFKRATGLTPAGYRQLVRGRGRAAVSSRTANAAQFGAG